MTVIAFDGKILAADKQATEGGLRHVTTKIMRIEKGKFKGYLMAGSGATSEANQMMAWFELGAKPEAFPRYQDTDDLSAQLLVIAPTKEILRFDFNPVPSVFFDEIYAMGSGRDVAMGAMAMGAGAKQAVEIASEICCGCGMGVDVITLKKGKN
jgi:ATP-dependent protease HslVU (ClpYQ) peptidase subunit